MFISSVGGRGELTPVCLVASGERLHIMGELGARETRGERWERTVGEEAEQERGQSSDEPCESLQVQREPQGRN